MVLKHIRTAKGRKISSTRWLERQLNDPYVQRARAENYRSRAAYKLLELDERFGLLKGVKSVVDLGIAPGGWSQVVRRRSPQAQVVGIDFLSTEPIDGVAILQMDFMDEAAPGKLREALGGAADLVLSDMAANTVGHQQTDHLRTMALVEAGLEFAREVLRPGGAFVAKVLAGGADHALVSELKRVRNRETCQAAGQPQGFRASGTSSPKASKARPKRARSLRNRTLASPQGTSLRDMRLVGHGWCIRKAPRAGAAEQDIIGAGRRSAARPPLFRLPICTSARRRKSTTRIGT